MNAISEQVVLDRLHDCDFSPYTPTEFKGMHHDDRSWTVIVFTQERVNLAFVVDVYGQRWCELNLPTVHASPYCL